MRTPPVTPKGYSAPVVIVVSRRPEEKATPAFSAANVTYKAAASASSANGNKLNLLA